MLETIGLVVTLAACPPTTVQPPHAGSAAPAPGPSREQAVAADERSPATPRFAFAIEVVASTPEWTDPPGCPPWPPPRRPDTAAAGALWVWQGRPGDQAWVAVGDRAWR